MQTAGLMTAAIRIPAQPNAEQLFMNGRDATSD
jgi:hypothetical protein